MKVKTISFAVAFAPEFGGPTEGLAAPLPVTRRVPIEASPSIDDLLVEVAVDVPPSNPEKQALAKLVRFAAKKSVWIRGAGLSEMPLTEAETRASERRLTNVMSSS